jgi:hypothetical protein
MSSIIVCPGARLSFRTVTEFVDDLSFHLPTLTRDMMTGFELFRSNFFSHFLVIFLEQQTS